MAEKVYTSYTKNINKSTGIHSGFIVPGPMLIGVTESTPCGLTPCCRCAIGFSFGYQEGTSEHGKGASGSLCPLSFLSPLTIASFSFFSSSQPVLPSRQSPNPYQPPPILSLSKHEVTFFTYKFYLWQHETSHRVGNILERESSHVHL